MNKNKYIEYTINTRKRKGKKLTKKELSDIFNAVKAMENLGAFEGDEFWEKGLRKDDKWKKI